MQHWQAWELLEQGWLQTHRNSTASVSWVAKFDLFIKHISFFDNSTHQADTPSLFMSSPLFFEIQ